MSQGTLFPEIILADTDTVNRPLVAESGLSPSDKLSGWY